MELTTWRGRPFTHARSKVNLINAFAGRAGHSSASRLRTGPAMGAARVGGVDTYFQTPPPTSTVQSCELRHWSCQTLLTIFQMVPINFTLKTLLCLCSLAI